MSISIAVVICKLRNSDLESIWGFGIIMKVGMIELCINVIVSFSIMILNLLGISIGLSHKSELRIQQNIIYKNVGKKTCS